MTPGSNLYRQATQVIARQTYEYYKFIGSTTDSRGRATSNYDPAVLLADSIQAVKRNLYEDMGLDFERDYVKIYTDSDLFGIERDYSGDQIAYRGQRFQLLSDTDWRFQDGWRSILAVRLANESAL